MDKAQAIHQFWNSFGLIAYDENTGVGLGGKIGEGLTTADYSGIIMFILVH